MTVICVYFDIRLVYQGNLYLFSMEFALTFQRNLHFVSSLKFARVFGEIRASCFPDEICVSFFDEFLTCFSMKFSFVGFKKFRGFGDYTQKFARYGDEPKCENGENRVVYTALGSIWSLDPLGPRNFDISVVEIFICGLQRFQQLQIYQQICEKRE